jgi:hypothetical protein
MSDTIRDRIAAVLYGNLRRQQRIDRPDRFLDWIDTSELADAVIAELGLKKESEMALDDTYKVIPMHRYVTEWTDGI